MKKRKLLIILGALLLMATGCSNKKEYLKQYDKEIAKLDGEVSYLLFDINKDKTKELIVRQGDSKADYQLHFYTYKDDEVVDLGEYSGGYTTLFNDKGSLKSQYAHMGYEVNYEIIIYKGQISFEQISSKQISSKGKHEKLGKTLKFKKVEKSKKDNEEQKI